MLRRGLAGCLLCGYEPAAPEVVIFPVFGGVAAGAEEEKKRKKNEKSENTTRDFPCGCVGEGFLLCFCINKKINKL